MMSPPVAQPSPRPVSPSPAPRSGRPGRRLASYGILTAAVLTALAAVGAQRHGAPPTRPATAPPAPQPRPAVADAAPSPQAPAPAPAPPRPQVELVFALDTTGSMGGLIEGAKRKIWSIASFIAHGQPTPDVRIGLVAYRDIGDEYVTKVFDLDDDLDRVYARLLRFRADGGGDTPEHVGKALHDAVHAMHWTPRQEVTKLIYLVGDAPPHTDYDDGFDYAKAARAAQKRGIAVHAVRCGGDPETETAWRKVAALGHGQYLTIGQDGDMHDEHSPYDEKLAELHDKLTRTVMTYGKGAGAKAAALDDLVRAAPAPVKASRAAFLGALGGSVSGGGDLVDAFARGKANLGTLSKDDLPKELRNLPEPAQRARLEERAQEQQALQAEIKSLADKRETFLRRQAEAEAKRPGAVEGFDVKAKLVVKKSVADNPLSGLSL